MCVQAFHRPNQSYMHASKTRCSSGSVDLIFFLFFSPFVLYDKVIQRNIRSGELSFFYSLTGLHGSCIPS